MSPSDLLDRLTALKFDADAARGLVKEHAKGCERCKKDEPCDDWSNLIERAQVLTKLYVDAASESSSPGSGSTP